MAALVATTAAAPALAAAAAATTTAAAAAAGGSGFSGGGGGSLDGGGGGGSYLASLLTDQVLKAGVNSGNGSITITSLTTTTAVPEPSTWAMMLAGFAGLGWLARTRGRKTSLA
jgi:hypothetical protein